MRRTFAFCAASTLALSALAFNPAEAAPYHVIKWSGNDLCQIWDNGIPTKPMPANYTAVSKPVPTFDAALGVKAGLMKKGLCKI